jgi:hypothetical protein
MSIDMQQVQLYGITAEDIQQIFEDTIKKYKVLPRLMFIDANYLYSFNLDDFVEVRNFNMLGRYYALKLKELSKQKNVNKTEYEICLADNSIYCRTWHNCLERWLEDQTVTLGDKQIKPIAISRSFDRVVNEGLEIVARSISGGGGDASFPFRSIGDGAATAATPADKILGNEIDRIDVNTAPEGGSLSRDGFTIYSVGNHSKDIPTPVNNKFTECGMHSTDSPTTDDTLDHSIFDDPVPHLQNEDSPGSTTIIYMCAS